MRSEAAAVFDDSMSNLSTLHPHTLTHSLSLSLSHTHTQRTAVYARARARRMRQNSGGGSCAAQAEHRTDVAQREALERLRRAVKAEGAPLPLCLPVRGGGSPRECRCCLMRGLRSCARRGVDQVARAEPRPARGARAAGARRLLIASCVCSCFCRACRAVQCLVPLRASAPSPASALLLGIAFVARPAFLSVHRTALV